jgi:hypothetical protein
LLFFVHFFIVQGRVIIIIIIMNNQAMLNKVRQDIAQAKQSGETYMYYSSTAFGGRKVVSTKSR